MLVVFQRMTTSKILVDLSKSGRKLVFRGIRIRFFKDLSSGEIATRANFKKVQDKLWQANMRNGISDSGKLLFTFQGKTQSFFSPKEAMDFYSHTVHPTLSSAPSSSGSTPSASADGKKASSASGSTPYVAAEGKEAAASSPEDNVDQEAHVTSISITLSPTSVPQEAEQDLGWS